MQKRNRTRRNLTTLTTTTTKVHRQFAYDDAVKGSTFHSSIQRRRPEVD